MEKKTIRRLAWCLAAVLATAAVAGLAWLRLREPALEPGAQPSPEGGLAGGSTTTAGAGGGETQALVKACMEKIERQAKVDEQLLAEQENGIYRLQTPFILLDPYSIAPLSAVAMFDTDEETRITVRVPGDTPKAEVSYTLQEYGTRHQVPICGLYPGRVNRVELTAEDRLGGRSTATVEIETEPLAAELQKIVLLATTFDEAAYQPGLNFSFSNLDEKPYRFAFDFNGCIRWYLTDEMGSGNVGNGAVYQSRERGIFLPRGSQEQGTVLFEETDLLGKVLGVYYAPYGSHHDTVLTEGGTLLANGSNNDIPNTTIDDFVYELDLDSGEILHTLDYKTVLQRTRIFGGRYSDADWMHMNAAVYCGENIVASSNFQSLVVCTDWDGNIQWMLGDPTGYLERYQRYLLTPVGEGFEWPYNQHAVQVLPDQDGDADTVDLLLFDNGLSRFLVDKELQRQITAGETAKPSDYSRMVQYRVNQRDMTVEQVWQYGKEHPELYGDKRGDANLLPNGNVLGLFSVANNSSATSHAVYQEVDRAGNTVWQCLGQSRTASNVYCEYKTERLELYGENAGELALGREAAVLIPEEIMSQCGY